MSGFVDVGVGLETTPPPDRSPVSNQTESISVEMFAEALSQSGAQVWLIISGIINVVLILCVISVFWMYMTWCGKRNNQNPDDGDDDDESNQGSGFRRTGRGQRDSDMRKPERGDSETRESNQDHHKSHRSPNKQGSFNQHDHHSQEYEDNSPYENASFPPNIFLGHTMILRNAC
jgi:hypothetical protein